MLMFGNDWFETCLIHLTLKSMFILLQEMEAAGVTILRENVTH